MKGLEQTKPITYQLIENGTRDTWTYDPSELAIIIKLDSIDEQDLPLTIHITGEFSGN